jgi:cyanophycinase
MQLTEARGKLVAVGGAEEKEGDCAVLKEFVRLARGPKARLVVMTVATDHPEESGREYSAAFKSLGVDEVNWVDVSDRRDADDEAALELIRKATGLYFTGGDQLHVTSLLGGTEMQRLVHQRYEKGMVVGGTSAGASMMSNSMIIGGASDENPRFEGVRIAPGMDLVVGAMIDTHFSQRGRHGRLLTAVAHYPQDVGIGIDEDTAAVINGTEMTVAGAGSVTIIDGGGMTYTTLPYVEKGDSLTLHDVRVHVLSAGARFDLANRRPVPEDARAKAARASEGGRAAAAKAKGAAKKAAKKEAGGKRR